MIVNVKKEDIFIPEWNGNRELPDADQIKVSHRFLSTAERERYIYWKNYTEGQVAALFAASKTEDVDDFIARDDRQYVQDKQGILRAIVTKIENLSITYGDDSEEAISTIEEFYKSPDAFAELRAELEGYALVLSARVDSKN